MKPTNEKSLFHFLCDAMEKTINDELNENQVKSICALSREAEKLLNGERRRAKLLMELDEHKAKFGSAPELRELAGFGFADTTRNAQTGNPRLDNADYCK